ncbi:MAG TPA: chromate transporter [Armatimonadaceae bacterium]|nr:chromate transporter [Armatimonadaceae bacterium]
MAWHPDVPHNRSMDAAPAPVVPVAPEPATPRPLRLSRLFAVWFAIGLQSFGGGSATGELIRRVAVDRERWVSEAEFARELTLVQLAPGMNLLALTLLLGRRVRGLKGGVTALVGLLVPSVTVAILLAALARGLGDNEAVRAALSGGVVPATVGMGLYGTFRTGRGLLDGLKGVTLVLTLLIAVASGLLAALYWGRLPVFMILFGGGVVGAVLSVAFDPKRFGEAGEADVA